MKGPGSGGGQASEVGWTLGGSSYMRGLESSGAHAHVTTVDLDFFSLPKWPYRNIHNQKTKISKICKKYWKWKFKFNSEEH